MNLVFKSRDACFDWNDLTFLLAVAETGSTLAAAKRLKVNQTTVARRLQVLEEGLGLTLVERRQSGYMLTEDGEMAAGYARRMHALATELGYRAAEVKSALAGVIRVTLTEVMANQLVAPALAAFHEAYPDIQIRLLVDDRALDLAKGEADVALRAGTIPDTPGLVVRQLWRGRWSLYYSKAYKARRGALRYLDDLKNHAVVRCEGSVGRMPAMEWLRDVSPNSAIGNVSTSLATAMVAAQSGLGIAALPELVGEHLGGLERCFDGVPGSEYDFFLLTRESLRHVPRVRMFNDYICRYLLENFAPYAASSSASTS